ncbi:hypothetical protein Hanom_Chr11g00968171 [Helianthus anomalus]
MRKKIANYLRLSINENYGTIFIGKNRSTIFRVKPDGNTSTRLRIKSVHRFEPILFQYVSNFELILVPPT